MFERIILRTAKLSVLKEYPQYKQQSFAIDICAMNKYNVEPFFMHPRYRYSVSDIYNLTIRKQSSNKSMLK